MALADVLGALDDDDFVSVLGAKKKAPKKPKAKKKKKKPWYKRAVKTLKKNALDVAIPTRMLHKVPGVKQATRFALKSPVVMAAASMATGVPAPILKRGALLATGVKMGNPKAKAKVRQIRTAAEQGDPNAIKSLQAIDAGNEAVRSVQATEETEQGVPAEPVADETYEAQLDEENYSEESDDVPPPGAEESSEEETTEETTDEGEDMYDESETGFLKSLARKVVKSTKTVAGAANAVMKSPMIMSAVSKQTGIPPQALKAATSIAANAKKGNPAAKAKVAQIAKKAKAGNADAKKSLAALKVANTVTKNVQKKGMPKPAAFKTPAGVPVTSNHYTRGLGLGIKGKRV